MKSVTAGHYPSGEQAVLTCDNGEVAAQIKVDAVSQCPSAVHNVVLAKRSQHKTHTKERDLLR